MGVGYKIILSEEYYKLKGKEEDEDYFERLDDCLRYCAHASYGEVCDFESEIKSWGIDIPERVQFFISAIDDELSKEDCIVVRDWLFDHIKNFPINWKFQHASQLILTLSEGASAYGVVMS